MLAAVERDLAGVWGTRYPAVLNRSFTRPYFMCLSSGALVCRLGEMFTYGRGNLFRRALLVCLFVFIVNLGNSH